MVRHDRSLPLFASENYPRPLRYSSRELSQQVINNANRLLDRSSIPANIRNEISDGLPTSGTDARTELYMQNYFQIIDELFFFNLVQRHVNMHYDYEPNTQTHGYFERHRQTWTPDHRVRDLRIVIQMRTFPGSYQQQLRQLIACVAHEMLHAFLDVYTCSCQEKCSTRIQSKTRMGLTGHGSAWAAAMKAVEVTMKTWPGFEEVDFTVWFHEDLEDQAQKKGLVPGIPGMPIGFEGFPGFVFLFPGMGLGGGGGGGGMIPGGEDSDPGGSDGEIESVRMRKHKKRSNARSGRGGGHRRNSGGGQTTGIKKKKKKQKPQAQGYEDGQLLCICSTM